MPTEKRKRKNDVILIASLTLAFALIGACLLLLGKQGDTVTVTVDGKVYGEYALARDTEVEILSDGGYNLLVIRDGAALIEDASCPDGICAAHSPISRNGESIICLPNKVVISVSAESENEPDLPA
jgi:hypothetical protein